MSIPMNPVSVWTQPPIGTKTTRAIKSLQRGSITIATSTASNTATITSVDTSKTFLTFLGWRAGSGTPTSDLALAANIVLTNATTITATRSNADGTYTTTVQYEAVECY